jgi:hypothetical protein
MANNSGMGVSVYFGDFMGQKIGFAVLCHPKICRTSPKNFCRKCPAALRTPQNPAILFKENCSVFRNETGYGMMSDTPSAWFSMIRFV